MKPFIQKHSTILFFAFIAILLFATNYKVGTYLLGWDSLQTELAPSLAIKRSLFSAWQEYQSFGLPAGMAHAADLVRALFMYAISFVTPQTTQRYLFHLLMVAIGALGMAKLLEFCGFQGRWKILPILGGLFYIFNFNVVQMMFLPFEPFSVFIGFLPWQIWAYLRMMTTDKMSRKEWLLFIGVNILATPESVAQQLFVVYLFVLGVLTLGLFFVQKPWMVIKRGLVLLVAILLINSFWILPQIYFLKTNGDVVSTAKINQLATSDVFYRNKDKGNVLDFIMSTGFFAESLDKNGQYLFNTWNNYRAFPLITLLLAVSILTTFLGLAKRFTYNISFVCMYVLMAFALMINAFPFSFLNDLLRRNSFINQVFRSPFTKFSIPYAVVETVLFIAGVALIITTIRRLFTAEKARVIEYIVIGFFALVTIIPALPAFWGNYFSPAMKVSIPQPYFETMNFFKSVDKNKRIGLLPEYTYWGWYFNDWGYNGSGFIWYGIEQPIISRTFDVWSTKSESYYWELKNAIDQGNVTAFNQVLDKYDVDYLIFDHSLTPVVSTPKSIDYGTIETLLAKSDRITLVKKFGFISIYEVNHEKQIKNFVTTDPTLPNIGPTIRLTNSDTAYQTYGDYQTNSKKPYTAYFPFLDLQTQTKPYDNQWKFAEGQSYWQFYRPLPFDVTNYSVSTSSGTFSIDMYDKQGGSTSYVLPYTVSVQDKNVVVEFPKIAVDSFDFSSVKTTICSSSAVKGATSSLYKNGTYTVTTTGSATGCFNVTDPHLEQRYGYIVKINTQNISGQPLFFYVLDKTKDQPYLEDRLSNGTQYYLIGSKFIQGIGYSFSFQSNSYKTIPSTNQVHSLSVYLMPYEVLKEIAVETGIPNGMDSQTTIAAQKNNYYTYTIGASTIQQNPYLILDQAYSSGWHAYVVSKSNNPLVEFAHQIAPFLFGKQLADHIIVNNWANGWNISPIKNSQEIIIQYLPQDLEYLGLLLLLMLFDTAVDPMRSLRHSIQNRLENRHEQQPQEPTQTASNLFE